MTYQPPSPEDTGDPEPESLMRNVLLTVLRHYAVALTVGAILWVLIIWAVFL